MPTRSSTRCLASASSCAKVVYCGLAWRSSRIGSYGVSASRRVISRAMIVSASTASARSRAYAPRGSNGPRATSASGSAICPSGSRRSRAACAAERYCSSITDCPDANCCTRIDARARCAVTTVIAHTTTLFFGRGSPTSPPGVDFTTVAEAAEASGLSVRGFATQAAFLLGSAVAIAPEEAAGARRLLLPGEMGEAVKCLWLTRDLDVDLPSFALQDLRHSL